MISSGVSGRQKEDVGGSACPTKISKPFQIDCMHNKAGVFARQHQ